MINKASLSKLNDFLEEKKIDTLILSISFDPRCRQVALHISPEKLNRLICCCNDEEDKFIADLQCEHTTKIKKRFGDHKIKEVRLSKTQPIETIDAFIACLIDIEKDANILLDISCFTHESLLILQKVIRHLNRKVTYVYCPATKYNPKTEKEADKWLSRGIGEVRSVLGYPGTRDPLKNGHLIVLVGFEVERTKKLIDWQEPTFLSLGYAVDETAEGAKKRNQKRFAELQNMYPEAEIFNFSAHDINTTKSAVEQQIKAFDANPIIAPMNTKISTLALALAAEENEEIQICYAPALVYNVKDYSESSDRYFWVDFDNG